MDINWLKALPKVELHIHLEGAIPHRALWTLVQKYGGDPDVVDFENMLSRFSYENFLGFIETWIWKNKFLRTYEDFSFIAEQVALDLRSQNIRYVEMFLSPPDFKSQGLKTQPLIEAVRKGLSMVEDIEVSLVPDLVRDYGPEQAETTLMEVNEMRDMGVVGVGLGGSEQLHPPGLFSKVFMLAKELGLHTTIHAGEAAGPESIWVALLDCQPDRIGHGTKAQEDFELVDYLLKNQIPLEMCPISNLRTGIIHDIRDHPIRSFFEQGLVVSINTDDPKMFGNSLASEYEMLTSHLNFSADDIRFLILQAVRSSWLQEAAREKMVAEFISDPAWNNV